MNTSDREEAPFFWGSATASHQVEGNNRRNDWWAWEQEGNVREPSGLACDQLNRYREDFDIIASLGHTAHRLSIEWSRLEPEEGQWNSRALKHYQKVLEALRERNIEPVVTLHHFTNPQWFAEKGGWEREDAWEYFDRYVRRVVEELGQYVRFWVTINEPMVYLYHGYCTGLWPPGVKSFRRAVQVYRQMVKGHVAAYESIHRVYKLRLRAPVWVSVAKHMSVFDPCRKSGWKDRLFTWLRDYVFNHAFLKAARSGFLFFPGFFCEILSSRPALDFIGLNYYTRHFVTASGESAPTPLGADCELKHHEGYTGETNVMGWEVYPEGLYRIAKSLGRYKLPVMVCENGICAAEDSQRESYIRRHLEALKKAGREGIEIWGFFYWSLLDNFEWAEGFGPRFGIVEVDYATQERKIRPSAYVLSDCCRQFRQESLH